MDKLFFLAQSKAASTILLQPFLVVFLIAIAESSDRLNSIPAYSPSVASLKHIKSNFLSGDNLSYVLIGLTFAYSSNFCLVETATLLGASGEGIVVVGHL